MGETLVAVATPLISATSAREPCSSGALSLGADVCVAVAALPATFDLQEYAVDLCDAIVEQSGGAVATALKILCTSGLARDDLIRCFTVLKKTPLQPDTLYCLLEVGLVNEDIVIRRLAASPLLRATCSDGFAADIVRRACTVAAVTDDTDMQYTLADVFAACASPHTVTSVAREMLASISDAVLRHFVSQGFEALCSSSGCWRTKFKVFAADMRALVL